VAETAKKLWKYYDVELKFHTPFAASIPKNPKDIQSMLEHRMPTEAALKKRVSAGENIVPVEELLATVTDEVGATEEEERGWATFKKDEKGRLYYEARCIRGHLKDCSDQVKDILGIKALHSKIANKVFPQPERIYLRKIVDGKVDPAPLSEVDGTETRFVHAMTMKGPRSSLKMIDYVENAVLQFELKVLNDGVITWDVLDTIFQYGATHGAGQERGQDFGRYELTKLEEIGKT
jgi:hypothetical protein